MKKLMFLALAAMLTTATITPSFAQDQPKCKKECCKKCTDKCKGEKCDHEQTAKKSDDKKSCCKKQA